MKRDHKTYRESTTGLGHVEGFLQGSCAKRMRELLKLNRNQNTLKWR
jgi:hypothetical protein